MSPAFLHRPVMADEIVAILGAVPPGTVVDATVGGGGHAAALLGAHPHLRILGIDRDPDALRAAGETLAPFGARATLHRGRFDGIAEIVHAQGLVAVSGVLFDLGVSSPQLDWAERGFSYRNPGPLDMRMDASAGLSAADVVNTYDERNLARVLARGGEPRWAHRVARAIVAARPIEGTAELSEIVRSAIPAAARRTGGHPATRAFQAIRIEVNAELEILPGAIDAAIDLLEAGGRCAALAYHSGEDRIVKDRFRHAVTGGCTCPPGLPCGCGAVAKVRLVTRGAQKPSAAEQQDNPRAASARLRAVERLAPPERTAA